MKKVFLTLVLACISACAVEQAPAPIEQKGARFYDKNSSSTDDDDIVSGTEIESYRSGDSVESRPLENPETNSSDFVPPSKNHRTGKSIKTVEPEQVDSSRIVIPNEIDHAENIYDEDEEPKLAPKPKLTSSTEDKEYLDISAIEQKKMALAAAEKKSAATSKKELNAKPKDKPVQKELKTEEPKEEAAAEEPKKEEKKPLNVSPKNKPQSLAKQEKDEQEAAQLEEAKKEELAKKEEAKKAAKEKEIAKAKEKEEAKKQELAKKEEAKKLVKEKEEAKAKEKEEAAKEPKKEIAKEEKKLDTLKPASTDKKEIDKKITQELAPKVKAPIAEEKPQVVEKLEMPKKPKETATVTPDIDSLPKLEKPTSGPIKFAKPVEGKIAQAFKPGGDGIVIEAAEGTPVHAAAEGTVVYSGSQLQGYGNMIVIKHKDGYLSAYSHLQDLDIKKGAKIGSGDVIGKVGKSGNAANPQLHFGIRKGRTAVNPQDYL